MKINERLLMNYSLSNKNYNYALNFLLSSIDIKDTVNNFLLLNSFVLIGGKLDVVIDDVNLIQIKKIFGKVNSEEVEILLWIALMFPEI